jgi:outer membrane protein TolC
MRLSMRLVRTCLGMLVVCGLAVGGDTLTLQKALSLAVRHHPQVQLAGGTVESARGSYKAVRSELFPRLNTYGGLTQSQQTRAVVTGGIPVVQSQRAWDMTGVVQVQQLLFDYWKTPLQTSGAARQLRASRQDSLGILQDVTLNAQVAYIAYLQATSTRQVDYDALALAQAHLRQAQLLLDVGKGIRYDVVTAQVKVASAQLNVITAENLVTLSQLSLENALGVELGDTLVLLDSLQADTMLVDLDSSLTLALHKRTDLLAGRLRVQGAESQMTAARLAWLPPIVATAGYGWYLFNMTRPWSSDWNVGLSLQIPPFLSGAIPAGIAQARGGLAIARAELSTAVQAVKRDVTQQVTGLAEASRRMQLSTTTLEQARLALAMAQERYRVGLGTALELTDAEMALTNTRRSRIQAMADYRICLARLERAMGTVRIPR